MIGPTSRHRGPSRRGTISDSTQTRLWAFLTFIALVVTLSSFVDSSNAVPMGCDDNQDCNCTLEQENLDDCSPASGAGGICGPMGICICNPGFGGPSCTANTPTATATATSTVTSTATSTVTVTATATRTVTATPTQTVTPTPVPQGGDCELTSQCVPGLFCADQVCCNEPCTDPGEACDRPGSVGICTALEPAPVPAASNSGLLILAGLLSVVGIIALLRRTRAG